MSGLFLRLDISLSSYRKCADKRNEPNVPLIPAEIAAQIFECWKVGAAVAHIHIRDAEGNKQRCCR